MKKYIAILIFSLVGMLAGVAQPPGPPHHHKGKSSEKLKALRKAYVNDKMDFNEEEEKFFWETFGKFKKRERALAKEMRPKKRLDFENMTDAQAETFYEKRMIYEEQKIELKRQFIEELKQKISFKKIMRLEKIERDFKREVMKRMKGKWEGRPHHHKPE